MPLVSPHQSRIPASPVRLLPIQEIAPGVEMEGPVPELADQVRALIGGYYARQCGKR